MVNIYLKNTSQISRDTKRIVYSICEYLQGNEGFMNNDIVVTDPDANGVFCISLGDDNTPEMNVSAVISGIKRDPNKSKYFLSTPGGSGITAMSKADILRRISNELDDMEEKGIEFVDITLEEGVQ